MAKEIRGVILAILSAFIFILTIQETLAHPSFFKDLFLTGVGALSCIGLGYGLFWALAEEPLA